MATIRATSDCRTIEVSEGALTRALERTAIPSLAQGLRHLVARRRVQVSRGVPLAALPEFGAEATEAAVRTVALLSELVQLQTGDVWAPVGDSDPNGAWMGFLVKGRVKIELHGEAQLTITAGSVVPEGLAAEFGAHIRADTACEAYRLPRSDFDIAVASDTAAQKWIWLLRLHEKQLSDKLRSRLNSAEGLQRSMLPHVRDREIQTWTARRIKSTSTASRRREERAQSFAEAVPPHGPPEGFMPLQSHTGSVRSERRPSSRTLSRSHVEAGAGLTCYPVVMLPKLPSRGGLHRSHSTPHLQGAAPSLAL